jgi:hypothetical protein
MGNQDCTYQFLCVNLAISDTYIFKVKQRERPDLERTVTYKRPPQNRMFDIPPSGRSRSSGTSSNSTPTPVLPNGVAPVIINMPDFMGGYSKKRSPLPSSDPVDYFDEPWPSLMELLTRAQETDWHNRNFTTYESHLNEQELFGPDDVEKCSAEDLYKMCDIPAGAGLHLIAEARRVCKEVKSKARETKCRRIDH